MSSKSVAYPTIVLTESEMFRNSNGEVCEVEVRGERTWTGCYFKTIDIGRVFGNKNLSNDIQKNQGVYVDGKDYVRLPNKDNVLGGLEIIYFTYMGLNRWLCRSHNTETQHYLDWMMRTLFTVQFGTMESKQQLASEITDSNNTIIKISEIALKHVANLRHELEETKDTAVREYETATELYTGHLETLQQENERLKQENKNIIREYESRMTKMRNGFRLQLSTLKDEARLYMDSIKGVMDMFL
jgi:hypothetical protein